ncbi:MAG: hypothetical protein H7323_15145 [Frankiales bacterium]|nr:hypothetical protein [Frankiales bacterium]
MTRWPFGWLAGHHRWDTGVVLRSRVIILPALAALALTGCSGTDSPAPQAAASSDAAAVSLVQTAAQSTAETGSSKFALTSTTAIGGQNVTFSGEGAFDYTAKTGQLMFKVPGQGRSAGGTIEQRIVGPDLYLTLPQTPGTFYRLKVADVAGTSLGGSTDPIASLRALEGVSAVSKVGDEQVRGVQTTHFRGSYDVAQAIAKATGAAKTVLESTLGASSLKQVPFDAFLDGQGRIVRFEQQIELPASAATRGQALTSKTVLELFDFGTTVKVVAPPAAKVKDGAPLLAALRSSAPKPAASQPAASQPAASLPAASPTS